MRILCYILVVLFVTTTAVGQQINPVPDYIFRNSMSVGRNAPTDTSAYFSIGPRFGATRGFMPPMVVDTAAVTGTKRNGLLIYSIQRNSYLYWDSTGMRWSRIAANLDTLQLATRAWRQKGDDSLAATINTRTDTLLISTRAWRQKGIDSVANVRVAGNGTSGYLTKFSGTRTIDTTTIFQSGNSYGINSTAIDNTSPLLISNNVNAYSAIYNLNPNTGAQATAGYTARAGGVIGNDLIMGVTTQANSSFAARANGAFVLASNQSSGGLSISTRETNAPISFHTGGTTPTERMRLFANGRLGLGTSTDAGFLLDINGTTRISSDGHILGNAAIGTSINSFFRTFISQTDTNTTTLLNSKLALGIQNTVSNGYVSLAFVNHSGQTTAFIYTKNINSGSVGNDLSFATKEPTQAVLTNGMTLNTTSELLINYTSDQGAYNLQVNGNSLINGNIRTAAPTGGTANDWRLGTVATVTPTSPNRTIEVSIGGTIYYIHAKTTND